MPQSVLSSGCDFPVVIYEAQFGSFPDKVRKGNGRIEGELKGRTWDEVSGRKNKNRGAGLLCQVAQAIPG